MKRKLIPIILVLVMVASMIPVMMTAASAADGYSGTAVAPKIVTDKNYATFGLTGENWSAYEGYYAISTAEELYGFAEIVNKSDQSGTGANAFLVKDIVVNTGTVTASGSSGGTTHEWTPIAKNFNNDYNYYKGTFDGRGHSISGLYASDDTKKPVGLFAAVGQPGGVTAVIKNVTVLNSYFTGASSVGAIVGYGQYKVEVLNCKVGSDVVIASEGGGIGGIVGNSVSTSMLSIKSCVFLGTITATSWRSVGSIAGNSAVIDDCYYLDRGLAGIGSGTSEARDGEGTFGIASTSAAHTCMGLLHPVYPATCEAKGYSEYVDCMICGTVLSGTKGELPMQHNWFAATCTTPKTCGTCGLREDGPAEHIYYYTANGATLTESCRGECSHSATATIALPTESIYYNGSEQTPATVVYSEKWKGGTLTVSYENATNASIQAKASITKENATATATFQINKRSLSDATVILSATTYPYAPTVTPAVRVTLDGKELTSDDYTVSYSGNNAVGVATVTVTGKGNYTGSASNTFEIVPAELSAIDVPKASVEFGDDYRSYPITGGKVVLKGTETTIPGTWSWSTVAGKATFTPDPVYASSVKTLEPVSVTVVSVAVKPIVTLTTPYPSTIAGQGLSVSVSAQNPYGESITDLPTSFTVYYRVGEDGTPVAVSGTSFVVPANLMSGDVLYVYAVSGAVDGKYLSTESASVTVTVKTVQEVVDEAMAGLDDLRLEILALLESEADLEYVNEKLGELNALILETESAVKAHADEMDAAQYELVTEDIRVAKEAAIKAAQDALDAVEEKLQALINTNKENIQKNAEEISKQVELLTGLIQTAESAAKAYADEMDAAQYETVTEDIRVAKEAAIKAARDALDAVEEKLQALINTNKENIQKNAEEITKQVELLTEMIELAEATAKLYADEMDSALKEHLYEKIVKATNHAMLAAELALEDARKELTVLIESGNKASADALASATDKLNAAIEAAEAAAGAADAEQKKELEASIEEAKSEAAAATESLKALLEGEIAKAKAEAIAEAQTALDGEIERVNLIMTILAVVAGLAFVGMGTLAVLYFVPKKRV